MIPGVPVEIGPVGPAPLNVGPDDSVPARSDPATPDAKPFFQRRRNQAVDRAAPPLDGRGPHQTPGRRRSYWRSEIPFYNTARPHSALRYRPPVLDTIVAPSRASGSAPSPARLGRGTRSAPTLRVDQSSGAGHGGLLFTVAMARHKVRELWPKKCVPGDHKQLRLMAVAVVDHLELCGVCCVWRLPAPARGTPDPWSYHGP